MFGRFVNSTRERSVEVWTTTCIVTNFGKTSKVNCSTLINPSNPELSGVRNFPYFPRGGPVPKDKLRSMHKDWQPLGYVSNWGGMEVGTGMLYPVSVVDGMVHQLGGWKLRAECDLKNLFNGKPICPVGSAIMTTQACDELRCHYDKIIHTTPPFFLHETEPERKLQSCFRSALSLILEKEKTTRIACPLLGAGARGFPSDVAIKNAALATTEWMKCTSGEANCGQQTLVFGLLENTNASKLCDTLEGLDSGYDDC